jgi:hypothetical protein
VLIEFSELIPRAAPAGSPATCRNSLVGRAIVPDFGRRIGRLAALSGERNGERRGRYRLLCLAYDLFGDSLFDASCRLGGKPTGHFL